MRLDPLHKSCIKRIYLTRYAESPISQMPPSAASDLPHLRWRQISKLIAIEFSILGKSHMIDIKIKPHADGVGRNEKINITRLVKLNLGIACTRRKRAHHHRRTSALAPDQFSDGINF